MSAWETNDMAEALPDASADGNADGNTAPAAPAVVIKAVAPDGRTPQQLGWAAPTNYDYASYNMTNRELHDARAAALTEGQTVDNSTGYQIPSEDLNYQGHAPGEWASNATVYQWEEEYGDVGPKFEVLEKQLFGDANHVQRGINFSAIDQIEVVQEGTVAIQPVRKFAEAGLHPAMMENATLAGYENCTPVQAYALPAILKGHDLVACAQTGSGKTAAYLVPILSLFMGKAKKLCAPRPNPALIETGVKAPQIRAEPLILIVAPTRELATQIFDEARRFCYRTMLRPCVIYGGGPVVEQILQLQKGCDLLIATPGRLCDFIDRPHVLTLKRLRAIVIDEADELLNNDWEEEMRKIMTGGDQEEGNIQYMMFSATFPKIARDLAKDHLSMDHVRIRVGRAGSSHLNIKQAVVFVEAASKRQALIDLLMANPPARTIIFVNSKRAADEVDDFVFHSGLPCTSIHSDRTQREREDSIRAFRNGTCPILIATGVSARGLDIHNVLHVINYDLPSKMYGGIEEYTHRIGRTGRIGNNGLATSFYNERDEELGEVLVKTLLETQQPIPDFLQQYIPEGFTAEGTGDATQLKFETDSDFGGDDENAELGADAGTDAVADAGGSWGAAPTQDADAGDSWGAAPEAAPVPAVSAWGAPEPTPPPVQNAPADASAWGAPVPTPANAGWGADVADVGW